MHETIMKYYQPKNQSFGQSFALKMDVSLTLHWVYWLRCMDRFVNIKSYKFFDTI